LEALESDKYNRLFLAHLALGFFVLMQHGLLAEERGRFAELSSVSDDARALIGTATFSSEKGIPLEVECTSCLLTCAS